MIDVEALASFSGDVPPEGLDALIALNLGLGAQPVDAQRVVSRMPLVFPLWQDVGEGFVGLLVWPTPEPGMPLPVVRCTGHRLRCLAPSARDLLRQQLGALDARGDLPGGESSGVYEPGEVRHSGLDLLRWQTARAGGSPLHFERVASEHLRSGDATAALVALEVANTRFGGWACTHASRHRLLLALGRGVEARDAALAALSLPVWTLDGAFSPIARAAGWADPIDGRPYRSRAAAPDVAPADRAAHLLDAAAVDEVPWSEVRDAAADGWTEAGLLHVAALARWVG